MSEITVVITARGRGERMKGISPQPKHLLYLKDKRVVEHIQEALYGHPVEVLDGGPDNSRKETLELLRGRKNILICDCDIIPFWFLDYRPSVPYKDDAIWYFYSDNPKYGGLYMGEERGLGRVVEKGDTDTQMRASGLYFLKDVGETIDRMTDENSIASGMIGAEMLYEDSFLRFGDPEDYLNALKYAE